MTYYFNGRHHTPSHIEADEFVATPGGAQHRYYIRPLIAYLINRIVDRLEDPFRRHIWPFL